MREETLMAYMRSVGDIPYCDKYGRKHRTIYESGKGPYLAPSGKFYMDFANYNGTAQEVPRALIDRLESEGKIVRSFGKEINAWRLLK